MISIVIPAYNAEKYLAETIDSVINQTYTNWELIIVDDGSTDNTKGIIETYRSKDLPIKYIFQENSGVSIARNNGMNHASGKYIALLDADDVWLKNNLELKIKILMNNPSVSWVYSNMNNADENMNIIGEAPPGTDNDILGSILKWEGEVVPGPCSNMLFDLKCFEEGCMFDPLFSTAADQDFTIQLATKYKGIHISKPLWNYRLHNNNMSSNISVMEKDHIGVYKKAKKNKLFHSFWFKQYCFSNLYLILAGSWWKNGNNKLRGIYFIILSILNYPPSIMKLIRKF